MPASPAIVIATITMALLLFSSLGKFADLSLFAHALLGWRIIPEGLRSTLVLMVPTVEFSLAAAWGLGYKRRVIAWASIGLLSVFSIAYAAETLVLGPPACQCFGLISAYWEQRSNVIWVLVRNTTLTFFLVPFAAGIRSCGRANDSSPVSLASQSIRGFTILELVLSIAIIGVLISLTLPALSGARRLAERTLLHSRLAGHVTAFNAYTTDFKEQWPCVTNPAATYTVVRTVPRGVFLLEYWDAYAFWHLALAEPLFSRTYTDPVFRARNSDGAGATFIWYSPTFIADPGFFLPGSRIGREQWRATRLSEVRFPSKKVIFACPLQAYDGRPETGRLPFAFVDGSVADLLQADMRPGFPDGTGLWDPGNGMQVPHPGMHTLGGLQGRDRD